MEITAGAIGIDQYYKHARRVLAKGIETYGLPTSGPIYDANLAALTDARAQDFRLDQLPSVTGDATILQRNLSILDVGCGPGTFLFTALRSGFDAYGVDIGSEKIELANMWAVALGYPQSWPQRALVADAGDLCFDDQTFDVVTSYHVLEHVSDLRSVLYEVVRVTKRGGWIELRAPDYRMSYDPHYAMPWPRFMPPNQAHRWAEAMGRPADGVGTFFYITAPEIIAVLQSLGCSVRTYIMRENRRGVVRLTNETFAADPIIFKSDREIAVYAEELMRLEALGTVPAMYETCLEFTIAAQRL